MKFLGSVFSSFSTGWCVKSSEADGPSLNLSVGRWLMRWEKLMSTSKYHNLRLRILYLFTLRFVGLGFSLKRVTSTDTGKNLFKV